MDASLLEILSAREQRAKVQVQLLKQWNKPLVCFTMNIAGPEKNDPWIYRGFRIGNTLLRQRLAWKGIRILYTQETVAVTGCEAFYVVDAPADAVKRITVQLEDSVPGGRLFDMDVLCPEGSKQDRAALGMPERQCLLCSGSARICGRSRAHSVQELQSRTQQLLRQMIGENIAQLAVQSLLCELYTTPKPGLVDCRNSGSHKDMDLFTFLSSSAALWPYFRHCAEIGIHTRELPPEETFRQLRGAGIQAEQKMLCATGGVNTHKGAVFTMGLLCGSAGRLAHIQKLQPQLLTAECAAMTRGLVEKDFSSATKENAVTVGQRLYAEYGITGARGQAQAGFPAVTEVGLPALEQGLSLGHSRNRAGCGALLAIMAAETDTNLIARSDLQTQQQVQKEITRLLQRDPYPEESVLEELDAQFIERNLSPGGSADLLAATYFLHWYQ